MTRIGPEQVKAATDLAKLAMVSRRAAQTVVDGKKLCSKCRDILLLSQFILARHTTSGFRSICKRCDSKWKKREEYRALSRARHASEKSRKWREEYRRRPDVRAKEISSYKESYLRRKKNPTYVLHQRFSVLIRRSLRTQKNNTSWRKLAAYSIQELKAHLEKQFLPGMSWGNMGEWHVDHIVPISSFDFNANPMQAFSDCWALSNLRPLWGKDNQSKHNKRLFLL